MPTLSKPVNIPGAWAYNGDKNTIPDTGADVGLASWAQGWGPINQLPLTAGGIPPARNDFNGALNALSAHVYYQQSGAYYDWSTDLMYPFPSRVVGSDGKVYEWVSASGAGTPAGAQDPTTDTDHTYWQPAVTGSDLPEFDGVTIKDINGKYGVPEFTPPTASAPGKAGLVPGPAASGFPQNVILTADQFQEVDLAFMHPTAESAELNKARVDMGAVTAENVNIDTLLRAGIFTATAFGGTLPSGVVGGVLYNIMSMGVTASSPTYYGIQILFTWGGKIYLRTNRGGIAPGGAVSWTGWTQIPGGGAYPPIPQAGAGVGQWVSLLNWSITELYLPQGGVWAWHYWSTIPRTSDIMGSWSGVSAGGTRIGSNTSGFSSFGFAWRIA